ncbi:MAG: DUF547 domain-containing protein, partial [Phycisphaerae bacterium]
EIRHISMPQAYRYYPCIAIALILAIGGGCPEQRTVPPGRSSPGPVVTTLSPGDTSGFAQSWNRKVFDHGLWDGVVRKHVDEQGRVDYAAIARSVEFREYLWRLSKTDAAGLRDDRQRLAFWINAYNALTIQSVLQTLPQDAALWPEYSVQDVKIEGLSLWKGIEFDVGGGRRTLDAIEHEILRKQDGLRDPRIHVALVCAARGCPSLWNRAYTGERIKKQLAEAMRRFVNDKRQCTIDLVHGVIRTSKVIKWYGGDFTAPSFSPHASSVPAFMALRVDDSALAEALKSRHWRFEYLDYDWKLNLRR